MTEESIPDIQSWARAKCEEVVHTCRLTAVDGATLFTPDGVGHYGAQWTRDFAYLVEHGGEFLEQMAELESSAADEWLGRAKETEDGLWLLWEDERGVYLAANEICRQVDVWGNAFLVAHGIGNARRRARTAQYLADNYDQFVYQGQVRHLPVPEYWERMFKPIAEDTYQNGGYWGTASGWLIEALHTVDPSLAGRTLRDLLADYRENGVLEWTHPEGGKGRDLYVATIVNVWSLVKNSSHFKAEES